MIAADEMRFGGANKDGDVGGLRPPRHGRRTRRRSTPTTTSRRRASPRRPAPNSPITFATTGRAKIYVGDYEARVTPVADTDPATELRCQRGASRPARYDMVAVSPDRGFTRWTHDGPAGRRDPDGDAADDVRQPRLRSTPAPRCIGATEGSLNAEALIDGTEATNWGGVTRRPRSTSRSPSVAVDLAGDVSTVKRVAGERLPHPGPGLADRRPAGAGATRTRARASPRCASSPSRRARATAARADATWTRFYTSPADAFPSALPPPGRADAEHARSSTCPTPRPPPYAW